MRNSIKAVLNACTARSARHGSVHDLVEIGSWDERRRHIVLRISNQAVVHPLFTFASERLCLKRKVDRQHRSPHEAQRNAGKKPNTAILIPAFPFVPCGLLALMGYHLQIRC